MTARSTIEQLIQGREFYLPTGDKESGTATDLDIDFAKPADEVVIVNGSDANLTYVVTYGGRNDGKTFTILPGGGDRFIGRGITKVSITMPGTGTWLIRGFR